MDRRSGAASAGGRPARGAARGAAPEPTPPESRLKRGQRPEQGAEGAEVEQGQGECVEGQPGPGEEERTVRGVHGTGSSGGPSSIPLRPVGRPGRPCPWGGGPGVSA